MTHTPPTTWYELPSPNQPDQVAAWSTEMLKRWLDDIRTPLDARMVSLRRNLLESLASTPLDPDLPLRYMCFPPSVAGELLYEFAVLEPDEALGWEALHQELLDSLTVGTTRDERAVESDSSVRGSISFAVLPLTGAVGRTTPTTGQVVAIVRRLTPTGWIDVLGRARDPDIGLLEESIAPVMSFLHGEDILVARAG